MLTPKGWRADVTQPEWRISPFGVTHPSDCQLVSTQRPTRRRGDTRPHLPGERWPRVVSIGILLTGAGGLLLAADFLVDLPPLLAGVGAAAFVVGVVLTGIGGGLRTAWEVVRWMWP